MSIVVLAMPFPPKLGEIDGGASMPKGGEGGFSAGETEWTTSR
jgi:hypothetical protein